MDPSAADERSAADDRSAGESVDAPAPARSCPSLLRVETVPVDGHLVVLLHGEVDITAWSVVAPLREQLAARGLPVVLDASRVSFMDCAGLAAVLSLTADGDLASVTGATRPVRVLLEAATRAEGLAVRLPDDADPASAGGRAEGRW